MRVLPGKRRLSLPWRTIDRSQDPWKAEPGLLKRSDVAGGRSAPRSRRPHAQSP
jgi:hypothetical protein